MKMEVVHSSKTPINFYQTRWHSITENSTSSSHSSNNLKSHIYVNCSQNPILAQPLKFLDKVEMFPNQDIRIITERVKKIPLLAMQTLTRSDTATSSITQ
jgi:hypothetical protein